MKKYLYLSVLLGVSAVAADQEVDNLYNQLALKTSRIDTDNVEQSGELHDVLQEVKRIVDECNARLNAALTKYPQLYTELGLRGNLKVGIWVDTDEQ